MNEGTILEFREISKSFPGVQALEDVSLSVKHGEVHAIVGENGAGKSTLMKILAGLYQPDDGEVILKGQRRQIRDAEQALRLGVAMVPQELNLVPEMSVAENILLGMEPHGSLGVVDIRQLHRRASDILASLGVGIDTYQKLKNLSVAEQQMVQIARALAFQCDILIMDEPTSRLSEREVNALFERIRRLSELGTTILYISHRMEEVFGIADRVTVLRDGKMMGTEGCAETTCDEIVRLMVGRSLQEFLHEREQRKRGGEVVLEVHSLTREGLFEDISFQLHRGEILGIAGLIGARRTDALLSVFGFPPADKGEILINGSPVTIRSPFDAIRLGIGYVPEERKSQGLFLIMSVLHNITIPFLNRFQRLSIVNQRAENVEGERLSQQLRVQTPSLSRQVRYLSGGNQQKVIVARWLGSGADILILDEPTRGIDVNAKEEIHAMIADMAVQDKSIIMISSELHEVMAMADRIIIMHEGHIVGEVYPEEVSEEDVLRLAMWGKNNNSKASVMSAYVADAVESGQSQTEGTN